MNTSGNGDRSGDSQKLNALVRGLGWFSVGLGLTQLLAPRGLSRLIGVREHPLLMRLFGLRELASGVGILASREPESWLWARVGGDALDLAALGTALGSDEVRQGRAALATAAVAGVTALDVACAKQVTQQSMSPDDNGFPVRKSLLIGRPPQELYQFWRNLENLPRFMQHLESVEVIGANMSHWVAKGPGGKTVEWDAEIIQDRPNELIEWKSVDGTVVAHSGSVRFEPAPGGRGTIVRVDLRYRPPAGVVGVGIAKLLGRAPDQEIQRDLRLLKQMMEAGEIARTEGQPAGRSTSISLKYDLPVRV